MQENIELKDTDKTRLKVVSARKMTHMKDLVLDEAHLIVDNDYDVPRVEREDEIDRTSLIIKVNDDFKEEIRTFCDIHSVRIRDFWVECVQRVLRKYENEA